MTCPTCGGKGEHWDPRFGDKKCPTCNGTGKVETPPTQETGQPKDRGKDGRFAWNQGPPPEELGDEELVARFGQACIDYALAAADLSETAAAAEMAKVKAKCRKALVERLVTYRDGLAKTGADLIEVRRRAEAAEKALADEDEEARHRGIKKDLST